MKRTVCATILTILLLAMSGCAKEQTPPDFTAEKDSQPQGYYAVTEVVLPDAKKGVEVPENANLGLSSFTLSGEKLFFYGTVMNDKWETLDALLRTGEPGGEWNTISLTSEFDLEGEHFNGLNGTRILSADGQTYGIAWKTNADEEITESYIVKLGLEGATELVCKVSDTYTQEADALYADERGVFRDREGNFYLFSAQGTGISRYDSSMQKTDAIETPGGVYGVVQGASGTDVYWYGLDAEKKAVIGKFTDGQTILVGFDGVGTGYRMAVDGEGALFLADTQNIWKLVEGKPVKMYNFLSNSYRFPEIYGMEFNAGGELIILTELDNDKTLLYMQELDAPVEKQEIVFAFPRQHYALERSIARFNRKSNEYRITVMLPEDGEDTQEFRRRVLMELSTGKGPDILTSALVTDVQDFAQNGYIESVDDIIADKTLYLQAALEAGKVDGKYYGIPFECSVDMVAYEKASVGERTSINLQELMELVGASGAEVLHEGMSGSSIVYDYALRDVSNSTYIDRENGESHLTDQPFLELLEFAKEYGDYDTIESKAFVYSHFANVSSGNEFMDVLAPGEEPLVLGYPRQEGKGNYVSVNSLYMSAGSEVKEGVKAFFKYLLSEEEQIKYGLYDMLDELSYTTSTQLFGSTNGFPISRAALDAVVEQMKEENKGKVIQTESGTIRVGNIFTEEMEEQFYFMLEHSVPANRDDTELYNMVLEELAPYFAGDMSAQEVAEKLDNRVQLYLDEMK